MSDWKRSEGKAGAFKYTAGKWAADPDDKGDYFVFFFFLTCFVAVTMCISSSAKIND